MIRLISAIDRKRGIAKKDILPWNIPSDWSYFKSQTSKFGGNVLMGHNTLLAMGQPLKGRRNFVLTRGDDIQGVEVVREVHEFLQSFTEDLWVIGGASVFEQTLSHADELYLTHIEADFGCDQFFPDYTAFKLASKSDLHEENGFIFSYNVYKPASAEPQKIAVS